MIDPEKSPNARRIRTMLAVGITLLAVACLEPFRGTLALFVTPPAASIPVGSAVQLTATAQDEGGTPVAPSTVMWTSSDTGIAAVSSTGLVTGVGPVTATITDRKSVV